MNPEPVTYWFCGKCEADYRSEEEAEECCGGTPETDLSEPKQPTAAELEALGQQRFVMTTTALIEVKPKRIQRKRSAGWRMPPNTVYVGRPTIFGNPFKISSQHNALELFRRWINGARGTGGGGLRRATLFTRLPDLRGKDLACWCKEGEPCHADTLLELANQ